MQKQYSGSLRKPLSVLLCAALIICTLIVGGMPVSAAWDGVSLDYSWYYTNGALVDDGATEADPYIISTPEQLAALAKLTDGFYTPAEIGETTPSGKTFSGKFIALGANIDLGGMEWTPISRYNSFRGTFDGKNYTISNLTTTGFNDNMGLFGNTSTSAVIKNIKFVDMSISGRYWVGGLVGHINGPTDISNIHVTGIDVQGNWYVGGLVGQCYTLTPMSTLTGCTITGTEGMNTITGLSEFNGDGGYGINVGGFAGHGAGIMFNDNSISDVVITGYNRVGGIAGYGMESYAADPVADVLAKNSNNTAENVEIYLDKSINDPEDVEEGADIVTNTTAGALYGELYRITPSQIDIPDYKNVDVYYRAVDTEDFVPAIVQTTGTSLRDTYVEPVAVLEDADGNTYSSYGSIDDAIDAAKEKAANSTEEVIIRVNDPEALTPEQLEEIIEMQPDGVSMIPAPFIDIAETNGNTTVTVADAIYDAEEQEPDVTVEYTAGGTTITLVEGTDYELEFSNNIDAADKADAVAPTVKVIGIGDYFGELTYTFTIAKRVLTVAPRDRTITILDGFDKPVEFIVSGNAPWHELDLSGLVTYYADANDNVITNSWVLGDFRTVIDPNASVFMITDFDGNDVTDNYEIVIEEGTLTIKRLPITTTATTTTTAATTTTTTTAKPTTPPSKVSSTRIGGLTRYDTAADICSNAWTSSDTVIVASGEVFADALAGATIADQYGAPILLSAKNFVPDVTLNEIKRLGAKNVIILGGSAAISDAAAKTISDLGVSVTRIAGKNRNGTAAEIAAKLTNRSNTAYIVSNVNFADALSISPIAAITDGSILFANPDGSLPDETKSAIRSLGITNAYIIGGSSAVGASAENGLAALGVSSKRVFGANRYDTSIVVYNTFSSVFKPGAASIATGIKAPDALAAAGFAAREKMPIFLVTESAASSLKTCINNAGISKLYVFGGTAAVSESIVRILTA